MIMSSKPQLIRLDDTDNVAVALQNIAAGTEIEQFGIAAVHSVPAGHKIATAAIGSGTPITKYGQQIGIAAEDIQVRDVFIINFFYQKGDAGQFDPLVRDIRIDNLYCEKASRVFEIRGFDRDPIRDVKLQDIEIVNADTTGIVKNVTGFVTNNVRINGELFSPGDSGL